VDDNFLGPNLCGDRCVNFLHDSENCGGCGISCEGAGIGLTCTDGQCVDRPALEDVVPTQTPLVAKPTSSSADNPMTTLPSESPQPARTIPVMGRFKSLAEAREEIKARSFRDADKGMTIVEEANFQIVTASFDAEGDIGIITHVVSQPIERRYIVTSSLLVLTKDAVAGFLALAPLHGQAAVNSAESTA
jgi:hypothetical protein